MSTQDRVIALQNEIDELLKEDDAPPMTFESRVGVEHCRIKESIGGIQRRLTKLEFETLPERITKLEQAGIQEFDQVDLAKVADSIQRQDINSGRLSGIHDPMAFDGLTADTQNSPEHEWGEIGAGRAPFPCNGCTQRDRIIGLRDKRIESLTLQIAQYGADLPNLAGELEMLRKKCTEKDAEIKRLEGQIYARS